MGGSVALFFPSSASLIFLCVVLPICFMQPLPRLRRLAARLPVPAGEQEMIGRRQARHDCVIACESKKKKYLQPKTKKVFLIGPIYACFARLDGESTSSPPPPDAADEVRFARRPDRRRPAGTSLAADPAAKSGERAYIESERIGSGNTFVGVDSIVQKGGRRGDTQDW